MPYARRSASLHFLALVLVTTLVYWPGLSGGWLFDDYSNIVHNTSVHAERIDAQMLADAGKSFAHGSGRGLAMATFAVDHVLWGTSPWGYKLTSLLVHLLNAVLIFALTRRLLALACPTQDLLPWPAFAVAAIWALHPLQVSTVHYVVQRMEMLSLTFVVLALLAYLAGRQRQLEGKRAWPWLLATGPLVAAGLLCKESAALFPVFALALELTLLRFAAANARIGSAWRLLYGIGTVAAVAAFAFLVLPRYSGAENWVFRDYDMADRLLTQLRVLPMYIGWIVLPQPDSYVFYFDHYLPSRSLFDPWTTIGGGAVIVALLAIALGGRRRWPLLALGVLWFFAAHAMTSNVVPLELVFEHRNYFAILGILLALTDLVLRLPAGGDRRVRPFAVGIVIAGLIPLTLIRSATWGDPMNLALDLAGKNPLSSRASMDLGEQFMFRAGQDASSPYYRLAEREFERGAAVPGASPMPEQGLLVLAATAGRPAKPAWWDSVLYKLRTRPIGPQEVGMIDGLLALSREDVTFDHRRLADTYLVVIDRARVPPGKIYAFGVHALEQLGDPDLARSLFLRAVEQSRGEPELVAAMADALLEKGQPDLARAVAERAAELGIARIEVPDAPVADNRPVDTGGTDAAAD